METAGFWWKPLGTYRISNTSLNWNLKMYRTTPVIASLRSKRVLSSFPQPLWKVENFVVENRVVKKLYTPPVDNLKLSTIAMWIKSRWYA